MKKNKLNLIPLTLVCIAPYLWLIMDIIRKNYERLLGEAILVLPTIIILTLIWRSYWINDEENDEYN